MSEIIYRKLVEEDYENYRELRLRCLKVYPDHFGTSYEEELINKAPVLEPAIKEAGNGNFVMGAFTTTGELVGICGFVQQARKKTLHHGDLIQFCVMPGYTGRGIGRELLDRSIDMAFENEQIELITLGVVETNENALHIYKQAGFIEYGKLDHYFKSGEQYFSQLFLMLQRSSW
jgi:ribosomal protein S18 acetylase RimI-like enzyme